MIRVPHPMNRNGERQTLEVNPIGNGRWRLTLVDVGRTKGSIVLNEQDMAKIAFHVYNQIDWPVPVPNEEEQI